MSTTQERNAKQTLYIQMLHGHRSTQNFITVGNCDSNAIQCQTKYWVVFWRISNSKSKICFYCRPKWQKSFCSIRLVYCQEVTYFTFSLRTHSAITRSVWRYLEAVLMTENPHLPYTNCFNILLFCIKTNEARCFLSYHSVQERKPLPQKQFLKPSRAVTYQDCYQISSSSIHNTADTEIEKETSHILMVGQTTQANSTAHQLCLHTDSLAHHIMLFSQNGEA